MSKPAEWHWNAVWSEPRIIEHRLYDRRSENLESWRASIDVSASFSPLCAPRYAIWCEDKRRWEYGVIPSELLNDLDAQKR